MHLALTSLHLLRQQVFIQIDNNESAAYYTLSGVKIAKPTTKGVYIYKGKKVVF